MNSKMLVAGGLVLAFVAGTMASGLYTATSKAFTPTEETTLAPVRTVSTAPVVRTRYVQPRTSVTADTVREPVSTTENKRSLKKSALIVGSSAGAGAAIGAVAGGKKGAAVGAVSGGIAGLIYDLTTRNKN
jgi:hypothetical protein